ncbi:S1 family peptidase [Streptosporangium sp. NBC_01469]|uniref:S1 family peptidase n=1 Tax=Streptosporangium sp. NBC_01469 TaxID=2903898 RepID=UPI002E2980E6|nr:S1 family peptidase [Streptosporangium sp. NBC_01469]
MARRHVIVPGCVLAITALALTAAPAVATHVLTAAPAVATRPAARASGVPGADLAGKPPPGMLEAIARDIGLTEEEAQTRLLNEARLTPIETSLRRRIGDHFGGSWFVPPRAQTLIVATTDPADVSQIAALGAQPQVVSRSLADLKEVKEKLSQNLPILAKLSSVRYVGVRVNKVVILTENPKAAQAAVKTAKVDPDAVQVIASTERPRLLRAHRKAHTETDLVGGQAYYVGATTRCSVGFSVTKDTQKGFISAGHCGTPGSATVGYNRRPQGTVQASTFPGQDFSWVKVNDDWNPRPLVGNDSGGTVHVYGAKKAIPGASACLSGSGAVINWRCGTIQQHDADITYPQGVVKHLIRTSACGIPGNSGGSLISINQAQGVISGGSGDCDLAGFTYIQPIHEILSAYDLTLMVNDVEPIATAGTCQAYRTIINGTLKSPQFAYQPRNRYYHTAVNADHYGCLESNPGSDFDLYLQKQSGSDWVTVASAESSNPFEELRYKGTPGDYRYLVLASSGTGPYTLGYTEVKQSGSGGGSPP